MPTGMSVTPGYFAALQMPITRGRAFTERDRDGAPFVAIVNEAMASRLWPGRDPIGQTLLQGTGPGVSAERPLEIVGVTRTGKYRSIGEAPRNFIYVPLAQQYHGRLTSSSSGARPARRGSLSCERR